MVGTPIGAVRYFPIMNGVVACIIEHQHRSGNWAYGCVVLYGNNPTVDKHLYSTWLACRPSYALACDLVEDTLDAMHNILSKQDLGQ